MQNRTHKRHWPQWIIPTLGSTCLTLLIIGTLFWFQAVDAGVVSRMAAVMTTATTAETTTIPYQGYVTDADGLPIFGPQDMTFKLYNQPTGGSPLWTESRDGANSVAVDAGLFNVMLGSVTSLAQSVVTENDVLYLGIAIGADSEMIQRVTLGHVPYAVQALTVPDGSITSSKLKLSHGEAISRFTPWALPLNMDFAKLSGTEVEIILDTPQTLIVNGVFDFIVQGGGPALGGLFVNGTRVEKLAVLNGDGRSTVGQTWTVDLDRGTHTLYLGARKHSDNGSILIGQVHTNMIWYSFAQ